MHQLLMQHGSQPGHAQQKHLKAGLTALSAAFKAWAASSATAEPLGQQEVASLAALVAAGGAAVDATAVQQIPRDVYRARPHLWLSRSAQVRLFLKLAVQFSGSSSELIVVIEAERRPPSSAACALLA